MSSTIIKNDVMNTKKNIQFIIIVGCGRLGSFLANALSLRGHSVVVIDNNSKSFDTLSVEFSGFKVEGDATEFAVLKQGKIDKADLLVATTREDNINIMVAQIAKKFFHVPKVVARVFEPEREKFYRDLGIEIVCPIVLAGKAFLDII